MFGLAGLHSADTSNTMGVLLSGVRKNVSLAFSLILCPVCAISLLLQGQVACFVLMAGCMIIESMLLFDCVCSRGIRDLKIPAGSLVLSMYGSVLYGYFAANMPSAVGTNLILPGGIVLAWLFFWRWMCLGSTCRPVTGRPRSPVELQDLKVVDNSMHGYVEDFESEDECKHNGRNG